MDYFRFYDLNEKAKTIACNSVKEIEGSFINWEKIHAKINYKLMKELSFEGIYLYQAQWEYGSPIADKLILLSDIDSEIVFSKMPKEIQELRDDLICVSNGYYTENFFFQEFPNVYAFLFNYSIVSNKEMDYLLQKYEPKIYEKYRLRGLTGTLKPEEENQKQEEFYLLAKNLAEKLTKMIVPYFLSIYNTVHQFIIKEMEYYHSDIYYFEQLNNPNYYLAKYYHFNQFGRIIDFNRNTIQSS